MSEDTADTSEVTSSTESFGDGEAPNLDDHWHSAFGIYVCHGFEENASDVGQDALGIHTHEDGLIHIHPFSAAASGDNATLGVFLHQVGVTLDDNRLETPDGLVVVEGQTTCEVDGEAVPGTLTVLRWPAGATENVDPTSYDSDFNNIPLSADGEAFVVAFVPVGASVPRPPNVAELASS